MNLTGVHVKGHQTEKAICENQLARMNDIAYHLATDFLRFCIIYGEPVISKIPSRMWSLNLNGYTIVSNVEKLIQQHINSNDMKEYWQKKGNISDELYNNVDWMAFGNACKNYTRREPIFNVKIQTGFLPTADRLHLFDAKHSSKCQCCGQLHESILRVFNCNNPSVHEYRITEIKKNGKMA